jgi:bifunctional non-homologous end joining protein LigD
MTARPGALPEPDEDYAHEMRWDGVRALAYIEDGRIRLFSRDAKEITRAHPELLPLARSVGRHELVLDGEIVAFDEQGGPPAFLLFDVLHVDAKTSIRLPYIARRGLLEDLVHADAHWDVPPYYSSGGGHVLEESRRLGLKGIVSKRLDSVYRPGRCGADWVKVDNARTQEVIVCGWKPGEGHRTDMIDALLVGVYEGGRLVYAGSVGAGLTEAAVGDLADRLAPLERAKPPFDEHLPREDTRGARWVEPVLVGEVQYAEWAGEHRLRHPSWRGTRADEKPREVTREEW